jgi:hypothetical protein
VSEANDFSDELRGDGDDVISQDHMSHGFRAEQLKEVGIE